MQAGLRTPSVATLRLQVIQYMTQLTFLNSRTNASGFIHTQTSYALIRHIASVLYYLINFSANNAYTGESFSQESKCFISNIIR